MGCANSKADAGTYDGKPKQRGLGGPSDTVAGAIMRKNGDQTEKRKKQTFLQNLVHEEYRRAITDVYDFSSSKQLGKGGFGTVQLVKHRTTNVEYALKTVELSRVKSPESLEFFMREVDVMKRLDHINIVRLMEVYPTPDYLFLVMDVYSGGTLLESYFFKSEADAANIVRAITNAIRYCHDRGIAHRDLKLDNVLLSHAGEGAEIKLVDFGLSALYDDSRLEQDVVGTWIYMAPEVIGGSHFPTACDMWSIGVIAYLLLCGYPPFNGDTLEALKWQIRHGKYQFHDKTWKSITPLAKNFIKRLLVRNPQERMSAAEAQHHPWLNLGPDDTPQLEDEAINNIKKFQQTNKLNKLALEVIARSLDIAQIRELETQFKNADRDGSGVISFAEFKHEVKLSTERWGIMSDEKIRELFTAIDVDGTGVLHFNDFLAATINRHELDEQRLRLAFDRLDYDRDGFISVDDLELTVGSAMERSVIKKTIDELDQNRDGQVDFKEFCNAMRRTEQSSSVANLAMMHSRSMDESEVDKSTLDSWVQQTIEAGEFSPADGSGSSAVTGVKRVSLLQAAQGLKHVEGERRGSKIEADALLQALAAAKLTAEEDGIDLEDSTGLEMGGSSLGEMAGPDSEAVAHAHSHSIHVPEPVAAH